MLHRLCLVELVGEMVWQSHKGQRVGLLPAEASIVCSEREVVVIKSKTEAAGGSREDCEHAQEKTVLRWRE